MKEKLILAISITIIIILLASGVAIVKMVSDNTSNKSSNWEKFSTFFKETRNNTSAYNVEAAGWNVRVVEWVPTDNPNIRCMFAAGTEKAGTGCYPAK